MLFIAREWEACGRPAVGAHRRGRVRFASEPFVAHAAELQTRAHVTRYSGMIIDGRAAMLVLMVVMVVVVVLLLVVV